MEGCFLVNRRVPYGDQEFNIFCKFAIKHNASKTKYSENSRRFFILSFSNNTVISPKVAQNLLIMFLALLKVHQN